MSRKLFIIGLDGADYSLTKNMLHQMPHLRSLVERGLFAKLKTTIPPISPTAWASFMTGTYPSKHRILDFTSRDGAGGPVNFSMVRGRTLWKILSDAGRKTVIFNVPITFPPEEVNGVLISGFPVPSGSREYTVPRDVAFELEKHGWDFSDIPAQSYSSKMLPFFLADLKRRVKERTEATLYLMEKHPWDFLMVHFMETDKVLHEFLNFTRKDLVSRKDYVKYKDTVEGFFSFLDKHLGKIFEKLGPEVNVTVLSDHGFGPCRQSFYTNTWLLEKGYIKLKGNFLTKLKYVLFKTFLSPIHFYSLLPDSIKSRIRRQVDRKYYIAGKEANILSKLLRLAGSAALKALLLSRDDVDWDRTSAYPVGNAAIIELFVNKRAASDTGAVLDSLKFDFKNFLDPKTKKPVFDQILSGKEAFGENSGLADLVIFDYSYETFPINHHLFLSNRSLTGNIWFPDRASHNMEGIFIAAGPDFGGGGGSRLERGPEQMHIVDCAPTILHFFGLPVPKRMDGKVRKEIFAQGTEAARSEVKVIQGEPELEKKKFAWSEEQEREVRDRLRAMGYL